MNSHILPKGSTLRGVFLRDDRWVVEYDGPEATLEMDDHGHLTCEKFAYRFSGKQQLLLEMLVPVGTCVGVADAVLDLYEPDDDSDDDCMGRLSALIKDVNKRLKKEGFPFAVKLSRGEEPVIFLASS